MKKLWLKPSIPYALVLTFLFTIVVPAHATTTRAAVTSQTIASAAQTDIRQAPTNQIIVKYKPDAVLRGHARAASPGQMMATSTAAGVPLTYSRAMSGDAHVLRLPARVPADQIEVIAQRIAAMPDVEYAEPDWIMFPAAVPNDPSYAQQWHYYETYGIGAHVAWDITTGSSAVTVAVLDTGMTAHPDLDGRWVGGYDFISNIPAANDGDGRDSDPHDPGNWVTGAEAASGPFAGCPVTNSTWHGTHVAGTIGAASNNGAGVAGINWVSPIVPVRVLGKCGGFVSDIADGLRWAAGLAVAGTPANAHPAKVINMSLGGPGVCSSTYQNAIDAVNAIGALIVVAVGNGGRNLNTNSYQPANCAGVIAVAATNRVGAKTIYSDYGALVKISAPGGETFTSSPSPAPHNGVLSTLNSGFTTSVSATYGYLAGTSMAAPHVAGVLSLMVSISPTLNYTESVQILQNAASPFPAGSNCTTTTCGAGIVNAGAALAAIGNPVTATPTGTPSQTPTATPINPPTPSSTPLPTATSSPTPLNTPTPSSTPLPTATGSPTPLNTPTPSNTPLPTAAGSPTPSSTPSATQLDTPTATLPPTATATSTPSSTPPATPLDPPTVTLTPTDTPVQPGTPTSTSIHTDHAHFIYLPWISNAANFDVTGEQASNGSQ